MCTCGDVNDSNKNEINGRPRLWSLDNSNIEGAKVEAYPTIPLIIIIICLFGFQAFNLHTIKQFGVHTSSFIVGNDFWEKIYRHTKLIKNFTTFVTVW